MGFMGDLFKKKQGTAPLDALRTRVDEKPNDARLAQDLANQLKASGDLNGAQEYARRAAQAHQTAGFATRALAVLKGAVAWGQPSPELLQDLANVFLELKHKEDARSTLTLLRRMHAASGNTSALPAIDAQLLELGPSR